MFGELGNVLSCQICLFLMEKRNSLRYFCYQFVDTAEIISVTANLQSCFPINSQQYLFDKLLLQSWKVDELSLIMK